MLSFISFWRAAAIVLSDLASSAYYAGGIAETAVGKSAPWFILGIMLFSYAVRAVYIESCSMFVRGGVYKVVHEAMGAMLAKFSVSALMFDYVLTGPISAVSAGLYLGGLVNEIGVYGHFPSLKVYPPYFAAVFATIVTVYFWRKNIIGMHESSEKALRIMQITTVMVVILLVWCVVTILKNGYQPVPFPTLQNIRFTDESVGWLKGTIGPSITAIDNMIGGLSMYLIGPVPLRLLFHGFVVLVGTLILSGAVNTAIIGSNGVLNRVAEDGVLPEWFRHPHKTFGTTSRLINTIVGLQLLTIAISRGDVVMLGEAYAFGVVWSFAMKSLSVLMLRYKQPGHRDWKVPLNFHIGKTEIPLGLMMITVTLFALAVINVLTKKTATISGVTFTIIFFIVFEVSDLYHRKLKAAQGPETEKFRLDTHSEVTKEAVHVRPGNLLVALRNPNHMHPLKPTLRKTATRKMDIVVPSVRTLKAGASEDGLN